MTDMGRSSDKYTTKVGKTQQQQSTTTPKPSEMDDSLVFAIIFQKFQLCLLVSWPLMGMFASFAVYLRYRDDAFFVAVCPPEIRRLLQNSQVNRGTLYALCIAVK